MERTILSSPRRAALIALLCAIASPAAARPNASQATRAANTGQVGAATPRDAPAGGAQTTGGANDDEVCFCTATYSDGTEDSVPECARSECPDLELYSSCRNEEPTGECRLLESCECDCRSTELATSTYYDPDVLLAGVPNLWQFDYRCGAFGMNAVGCGPVAASMMMYWWAQQGYDGLVDGFMSGPGSSPAVREHDWQAMVSAFRDDYLNGGICVVDQYATLQGTMRDGIDEYIADSGYSASVGHYKVCDDCNRNESEELSSSQGLELILDELRAGRPVIMGFNVGRAMNETVTLDDEDGTLVPYSGELSNGTPLTGIISHYAVITGYRHVEGQDVLIMNLGWEGWYDIAFLWNPAGAWLHLYTIDLNGAPTGDDFCAIDRGIDATFLDSADLDLSSAWSGTPYTVLAGNSCGILREVTVSEYYPTWSGTHFECDPFGGFGQDIEQGGVLGGTTTNDPRGGGLQQGGRPPILDEELPLP